jgi:menaquinone-dependent protoporphyrinogen oxidase
MAQGTLGTGAHSSSFLANQRQPSAPTVTYPFTRARRRRSHAGARPVAGTARRSRRGAWFPATTSAESPDGASCGARERSGMTNVLVAYSSKHGATAEIAEAIALTLRETGVRAECVEAGDVEHLDGYDGVVLGSAVYMRRWRRSARSFLRRHANELAERPLWVFSSGPIGDPAKDNPAWLEPGRTIAQVEALGARGHVIFGGRSEVVSIPPEFRDRRDWDGIRAWALEIGAELASPPLARPAAVV